MTTSNQNFKPIQKKDRINSLDVIRGIALLGILLMNINGMGLPFAYGDPSVAGGSDGANLYVWVVNNMLFEGTMRGLFTLLFGAGVILLTSRLQNKGAGIITADIYYRRLLWLLLFGIINVYIFLWEGDILYPYAIFGLMLFPFRNSTPKKLIGYGLVLLLLGMLWDSSDYQNSLVTQEEGLAAIAIQKTGDSLTKKQQTALDKWEKKRKKKTPEEVQEEIDKRQKGYWSNVKSKVKTNQLFQTWFVYRYWPWDLMSFMLIGMAFFKLRIFHGERTTKYYLLMAVIGYLIGLSVNYYETCLLVGANFDVMANSQAGLTYQLGRMFTTLGHVGLFMLFIKSGMLRFLQNALAAVGKMALTNYLVHSIIAAFLFYGFGFSLFGQLERHELYYIVGGIWIVQLIYSPIWFKYFQFGPAEWLWRSLTYKKRQPFKNT
ncbi:DUF418 domain-containing protein [Flagellimonas myxillae]|uniref:DUF418 domain-containing protein n=1 Tax=Flagellimonas myxillae TaxID=2942214 RepID=UPI00201E779E|nr:DUF418 domain-containing protein [Muricauda myxillae]MCL6265496.1 DUF418 domain-containing protein [Muricauda myxillae]